MALTPSELRRRKMNLLMAMSYAAYASTKASTWSPTLLFAAGEQGAWYDPSDFSTMFQDAAGTTPVTAVEQPVGLILDKSKGLAIGSELVTNGDFSAGTTGWTAGSGTTITVSSGMFRVEGGPAYQGITTVAGRWYLLTLDVTATNPGGIYIGTTATGGSSFDIYSSGPISASGRREVRFRATGTTTYINVWAWNAGIQFCFYDNISVKALAGNHASQSTSASRPVLSARVNLLTYSEQFDNAAWIDGNISSGTRTNGSVSVSAVGGYSYIRQNVSMASGASYTCSFEVTCDQTIANVPIRVSTNTGGSGSTLLSMTANQTYRVSITGITGTANIEFGIDVRAGVVPGGSTSTGYTVTFNRADLRVTNDGVGLPAYQRVAAATNYDTNGFPLYLKFDGTDDSLVTASIDFSATDTMSVFAGMRKLSDASQGFIAHIGDGGTNDFMLQNYTDAKFYWGAGGSSFVQISSPSISAPATRVLTGLSNISADSLIFRVNGSSSATSSSDQGTGQFSNSTLKVGSNDGGSSKHYNGRLYSLIVRGAQSTDAQIASTETWVNNVTKGY
jgi:hypothetical protein